MRSILSAGKIFVLSLILFGAENGFLLAEVSSSPQKPKVSIWNKIMPSKKSKYKNLPTTVAGVRGMDEPEGVGDSNSRDWEGLKKVESYADIFSNNEEIQNFISEGGLK